MNNNYLVNRGCFYNNQYKEKLQKEYRDKLKQKDDAKRKLDEHIKEVAHKGIWFVS